MPERHNKKLDRVARRERLRHLGMIVVPVTVIIALFFWVYSVNEPFDPFATRYLTANRVSQTDISSGTGVAFEVTARFDGLQKSFQTDDPDLIAGLSDTLCVEETRGAPIGEDIPRPRYHRLVTPEHCQGAGD